MWSPLQAFFDGITSFVGRSVIAILMLFGGFTTSAPWQNSSLNFFQEWCVASFAMPVEWATYFEGFGCLIGFALLVSFIFFATLFIYEWAWKSSTSIFGMYVSATMYFLPLSDEGRRSMFMPALYCALVYICFWGIPSLIKRIHK